MSAVLSLLALGLLLAPGTGCPPPAPSITFGQTVAASVADNGNGTYLFTTPALGNNVSTLASFRVEDASPVPGNPGSWRLELRIGTTLLTTVDPPATPGAPTLLKDVNFSTGNPPAGGTVYAISAVEVSGPLPRSFKLTMSPRYQTPLAASFGSTASPLLLAGEFETYSLLVGPTQVGRTDLFLREPGTIAGSNNVTVLDTDHVTIKANVTASNDVSVDNSEQDNLTFGAAGDYIVIVRNTDVAASGTYNLIVGPSPIVDQPASCEPVLAPGFGTPTHLVGKALSPEADRDCYQFSLPFGVGDIGFGLDETGSTPGSNEVRLFKNGALVTAKKASTDVNGTSPVDADGPADYQVETNNLADGAPNYALDISLVGSCIGVTCILTPDSQAALDFPLENPATRQIRQTADGLTPLPFTAIASLEFDKTSSGTFDLRVLGNTVSGLAFLCGTPISGTTDLFRENCALTTTDGMPFAVVQRTSGSGATGTMRMGPNLRPKADSPTAYAAPTKVDGNLASYGDASIYSFTLAAAAEVGIGFDDQGIGGANNSVTVCPLANVVDCLTNPLYPTSRRYTGPSDGSALAETLAAGPYALIVDNADVGTGDFAVCVGPAGIADVDVPIPVITTDLVPGGATGGGGALTCGDTDRVGLSTTVTQPVRITVTESGSQDGNLVVTLQRETSPNVWVDNGESDSGGSSTNFNATLNAGVNYRLVIDNSTVGSGGYGITVSDPNG